MASVLVVGQSGASDSASYIAVENCLRHRDTALFCSGRTRVLDGSDYLTTAIAASNLRYFVVIDGQTHHVEEFDAIWYLSRPAETTTGI